MNMLLKLGILLAMLLSSLLGTAQSKSNKIYDMFSGEDGVSSLSLTKSALTPYEIFFDDETKEVINKLERFRFMSYDESKGRLSSFDVFERISNELNTAEYFTIDPSELNCRDCGDTWNNEKRLWGRGSRSAMDEFHILIIDNTNCILFSFFGNMSIDDINKCASLSNSAEININTK